MKKTLHVCIIYPFIPRASINTLRTKGFKSVVVLVYDPSQTPTEQSTELKAAILVYDVKILK